MTLGIKKIGSLRGASWGENFEQFKRQRWFSVEEDVTPRKRLLKLLHGRIDVAIIGPGKEVIMAAIAGDNKLSKNKHKFLILSTPFKRDPNYLGFTKTMKMRGFLDQFDAIIKEGHASGELAKIINLKRD